MWVDNFSTCCGPFGIIVGGDIGRLGRAVSGAAYTSISSTSWSSTSVGRKMKTMRPIEDAPVKTEVVEEDGEGENRSPHPALPEAFWHFSTTRQRTAATEKVPEEGVREKRPP